MGGCKREPLPLCAPPRGLWSAPAGRWACVGMLLARPWRACRHNAGGGTREAAASGGMVGGENGSVGVPPLLSGTAPASLPSLHVDAWHCRRARVGLVREGAQSIQQGGRRNGTKHPGDGGRGRPTDPSSPLFPPPQLRPPRLRSRRRGGAHARRRHVRNAAHRPRPVDRGDHSAGWHCRHDSVLRRHLWPHRRRRRRTHRQTAVRGAGARDPGHHF